MEPSQQGQQIENGSAISLFSVKNAGFIIS